MKVLSISITEAGRLNAQRLAYETVHGELGPTVRELWNEVNGLILFCSVGIATRVVGPLLGSKAEDPVVVTVDEAAKFVVSLTGGHRRKFGANDLTAEVASILEAQPVITTATDSQEIAALDTLPNFVASGDLASVSRSILDGQPLAIDNHLSWPLPTSVTSLASDVGDSASHTIVVSDQQLHTVPGQVILNPPSLVLGVGASSDAPAEAAQELLDQVLAEHELTAESIGLVATIDRRAGDPVINTLDMPVRSFTPADLAPVSVPNPSETVMAEVGTASVAEAAALLAASKGANLIVEKTKGATVTVAIARRRGPEGSVAVVGLGPGHPRHRTTQAIAAIRHAEVVIGYSLYVDQCVDLQSGGQEIVRSPIGAELDRCAEAVKRASEGQQVALVCSGDPGVFAMATLVLEVAPKFGGPPVEIVPGVTASLAASAILGAPLGHDHADVSLSDLLTPWSLIERRIEALATADMAVALYNPRSGQRTVQLEKAMAMFAQHRPADTPVSIIANASRPNEKVCVTTIKDFDCTLVDMFSIVIVGSSTTELIGGRVVTPRGYSS